MTNQELARRLRDHASSLARGGNNLYRVRAFRQAAMTVLTLPDELAPRIGSDGARALENVPGIGRSLAKTITEYLSDPGAK
jgi:DNA polymerase/3'-5' exonuclease PolX